MQALLTLKNHARQNTGNHIHNQKGHLTASFTPMSLSSGDGHRVRQLVDNIGVVVWVMLKLVVEALRLRFSSSLLS